MTQPGKCDSLGGHTLLGGRLKTPSQGALVRQLRLARAGHIQHFSEFRFCPDSGGYVSLGYPSTTLPLGPCSCHCWFCDYHDEVKNEPTEEV